MCRPVNASTPRRQALGVGPPRPGAIPATIDQGSFLRFIVEQTPLAERARVHGGQLWVHVPATSTRPAPGPDLSARAPWSRTNCSSAPAGGGKGPRPSRLWVPFRAWLQDYAGGLLFAPLAARPSPQAEPQTADGGAPGVGPQLLGAGSAGDDVGSLAAALLGARARATNPDSDGRTPAPSRPPRDEQERRDAAQPQAPHQPPLPSPSPPQLQPPRRPPPPHTRPHPPRNGWMRLTPRPRGLALGDARAFARRLAEEREQQQQQHDQQHDQQRSGETRRGMTCHGKMTRPPQRHQRARGQAGSRPSRSAPSRNPAAIRMHDSPAANEAPSQQDRAFQQTAAYAAIPTRPFRAPGARTRMRPHTAARSPHRREQLRPGGQGAASARRGNSAHAAPRPPGRDGEASTPSGDKAPASSGSGAAVSGAGMAAREQRRAADAGSRREGRLHEWSQGASTTSLPTPAGGGGDFDDEGLRVKLSGILHSPAAGHAPAPSSPPAKITRLDGGAMEDPAGADAGAGSSSPPEAEDSTRVAVDGESAADPRERPFALLPPPTQSLTPTSGQAPGSGPASPAMPPLQAQPRPSAGVSPASGPGDSGEEPTEIAAPVLAHGGYEAEEEGGVSGAGKEDDWEEPSPEADGPAAQLERVSRAPPPRAPRGLAVEGRHAAIRRAIATTPRAARREHVTGPPSLMRVSQGAGPTADFTVPAAAALRTPRLPPARRRRGRSGRRSPRPAAPSSKADTARHSGVVLLAAVVAGRPAPMEATQPRLRTLRPALRGKRGASARGGHSDGSHAPPAAGMQSPRGSDKPLAEALVAHLRSAARAMGQDAVILRRTGAVGPAAVARDGTVATVEAPASPRSRPPPRKGQGVSRSPRASATSAAAAAGQMQALHCARVASLEAAPRSPASPRWPVRHHFCADPVSEAQSAASRDLAAQAAGERARVEAQHRAYVEAILCRHLLDARGAEHAAEADESVIISAAASLASLEEALPEGDDMARLAARALGGVEGPDDITDLLSAFGALPQPKVPPLPPSGGVAAVCRDAARA